MKDTLNQIQIYYEMAMSLGNSLDLKKMLKEGLLAYLEKLNCSAGSVLEKPLHFLMNCLTGQASGMSYSRLRSGY